MAFSASVIFKAQDGISASVKRMQNSVNVFGLNAQSTFWKTGIKAEEFSGKMNAISSSMLSFKNFIVGGLIIEGVKQMYSFVTSTLQGAKATEMLSKRTGIGVQEILGLGYAAEKVGVSTDKFSRYIGRFSAQMGKLKMGDGELFKFLMSNDQHLLFKLKHTKDLGKAFDLFSDSISRIQNPMLRSAMISAALGNRAQDVAGMFMLGAKGIHAQQAEFNRLAGDQKKNIANLDLLRNSQIRFNAVLNATKMSIASALVPAFNQLFNTGSNWLIQNREMITSTVVSFFNKFTTALKFVSQHLGLVTGAVMWYIKIAILLAVTTKALQIVTLGYRAVLLLLNIATAIQVVTNKRLLSSILLNVQAVKIYNLWTAIQLGWINLTTSAIWANTAALLANPITWIVVGIMALIAGLGLLIFNWDSTTSAVERWANSSNWCLSLVGNGLKILTDNVNTFGGQWDNIGREFSQHGAFAGSVRWFNMMFRNMVEPLREVLYLFGQLGWKSAGNAASVLAKEQDKLVGVTPVNKDAAITQRSIVERNTNQGVQINIADSTGRASVIGTSPIPIIVTNTKGYGFTNR